MGHWLRCLSLIVFLAASQPAAVHAASVGQILAELAFDLSGTWKIAYDRRNVGLTQGWQKKPPSEVYDIRVPSCFEETREGAGYDGVVWYFTNFIVPDEFRGNALYLEFAAVNYACRVWLNGIELGGHEGGYHRFCLAVGSAVRWSEQNDLVVRVVDPGRVPVDGLTLDSIPHGKESWYFNFGGIYGQVRLLAKPAMTIEDIFVSANPQTGNVTVALEIENRESAPANTQIRVKVVPRRQGREVASVEQDVQLTSGTNRVSVAVSVANPQLWSPDSPFLYRLTATLGSLSSRQVDFGFRSFTIEQGEFRLNGKPVFLRGVLYQPYFPAMLACPIPDHPSLWPSLRIEAQQIKQAGFNMVRFHASVAPPDFLNGADALGLMVIEEPSIGWPESGGERLAKACLAEVGDMVLRDRNHPCVVAWGTVSQATGELAKLTDQLARRALDLDPSRPVFGNWPASWAEASQRTMFVYLPGQSEPMAIGGGQVFPRFPLSDQEQLRLGSLGASSPLAFLAAVGPGGVGNPRADLEKFAGREYL
ncbi:hypothetical protein FJY63_03375, partial [Candidatus Sumerlaeota bacterium]|nr:hypothetical protein [Candidatus Sumerlaeota bacterium]